MNDNLTVFNVTRLGASHTKSGKPCQDYSLSWQSDDNSVQVAIVCDGHGGDTYVRSDVGSRLAAEITLKHLKAMSDDTTTYAGIFFGRKGAVTARPTGPRKLHDPKSPSESEMQLLKQDALFKKQIAQHAEQDKVVMPMFKSIYDEWAAAIEADAKENPFTDYEAGMLGKNRIAKAYGTTLMAFMRTPYYWFAFHIGDGKMLACDRTLTWVEPVPWDCNCFLNVTTSLCNSNPLPSFRYALDGTGAFPMAVIMGSDGLDDSWVTMPKLQHFYAQTLEIFANQGRDKTVDELGDYLTKLSATGSRDDMSMAGILNMDLLDNAFTMYATRQEGLKLKAEFTNRQSEMEKLNHDLDEMKKNLAEAESKLATLEKQKQDVETMRRELQARMVQVETKAAEYAEIDKEARARNAELIAQWNTMKEKAKRAEDDWRAQWMAEKGAMLSGTAQPEETVQPEETIQPEEAKAEDPAVEEVKAEGQNTEEQNTEEPSSEEPATEKPEKKDRTAWWSALNPWATNGKDEDGKE